MNYQLGYKIVYDFTMTSMYCWKSGIRYHRFETLRSYEKGLTFGFMVYQTKWLANLKAKMYRIKGLRVVPCLYRDESHYYWKWFIPSLIVREMILI